MTFYAGILFSELKYLGSSIMFLGALVSVRHLLKLINFNEG